MNEVEKIFEAVSDLPDESLNLILPSLEGQFEELAEDTELIEKMKQDLLSKGWGLKDVIEERNSYSKILDDFLRVYSPTSAKGKYVTFLVNTYIEMYDRIIEQGFSRIVNVEVELIDGEAKAPVYAHNGDAGCDVFANEPVRVLPGETKIIPTGIKIAIPSGYEVQIRPRSGLSAKTNTKVTLGTVDSNYRGEIGVIFSNYGNESFHIEKGDRIAQLIIAPSYTMNFIPVDKVEITNRGADGFGSTDEHGKEN